MTPPLPPEQNIGPYYRAMGLILVAVAGLIALGLVFALLMGAVLTDNVVYIVAGGAGIFLLAMLIVIRPPGFDSLFKTVIAALPFTKYTGQPPQS